MIKSLRRSDGTYSQFALFLLGAVPQGHKGEPLPVPAPGWQQQVLMSKISKWRKECIKHEARRIRMSEQSPDQPSRAPARELQRTPASNPRAAVLLRALKRKLITIERHRQKLIDETLEQLVA